MLIHLHRFQPVPKKQKFNFFCLVHLCRFIFIFIDSALCERDSGAAHKYLFGRPYRKLCHQERQGDRGRGFSTLCKREIARGLGARISRLEYEGLNNSSRYMKCGKVMATIVSPLEIEARIESYQARVA